MECELMGKSLRCLFMDSGTCFLSLNSHCPLVVRLRPPAPLFCNHSELPLINNYLSIEHDMTVLLVFELKPIYLHHGRKTQIALWYYFLDYDKELLFLELGIKGFLYVFF